MLFSERPRSHYDHAPVHEVICQLRFPSILAINDTEPAAFQELIREDFPQYARKVDMAPPKLVGMGGPNPQIQQAPGVTNYHFLSADGRWKLNLTRDFIALSTLSYDSWEEFARLLDKPLAAFIKLYQPAYFQRVGLRYLNIITRSHLGLDKTPWSQLITPSYIAPMLQEDVREEDFLGCNADLLLKLDSSCRAKIHSGPAQVKLNGQNAPQDPELKFILDMDLSMSGNVSCTLSAPALETLHGHAGRIFEGAVTDTLRSAMTGE